MPIYEYQCEKCNNDFEKLIFNRKDESVDCPDCGNKKVKRLLSTTRAIGGGVEDCGPNPGKGFS
jgi:putative FmdB family regulatory protein